MSGNLPICLAVYSSPAAACTASAICNAHVKRSAHLACCVQEPSKASSSLRQGHPLQRCLSVLNRVLEEEDAEPFSEPVSALPSAAVVPAVQVFSVHSLGGQVARCG